MPTNLPKDGQSPQGEHREGFISSGYRGSVMETEEEVHSIFKTKQTLPIESQVGWGQNEIQVPYSDLLGSQAQVLKCPSSELWTKGFKTLTDLGTIDRCLREPTLINPILEIQDFRSMDCVGSKRKAVDGFFIYPSGLGAQSA